MFGNMTLAIINALTIVMEVLLSVVLMDSFFEVRFRSKTVKYLLIFLTSLLLFGVNYLPAGYPLRTPLEILIIILLLNVQYTGRLRDKVICCAVWSLALALSSMLSSIIMTALPEDVPILGNNSLFYATMKIILPKACLMLLIFLLSAFLKEKKIHLDIKYWLILLAVPFVTIAVLSVFQLYIDSMPPEARVFSEINEITINGQSIPLRGLTVYGYIMTAVIGLLFINILVFILFARVQKSLEMQSKYELLEKQTEMQSRSVEKLENSYMRMRELRHDMQNQLTVMNSLLENQKYDDLKSYIKTMINTVDEAAFMTISRQSAVDALLNEKLLSAHKNQISTDFDIADLQHIFAQPMDLCVILANALDNAVEACVKLPEGQERYIRLKITANEDFIVVSCQNPVDREPKIRGGEYVSSKKDKNEHGFGLRSIKTTADKYRGEYMTRCRDGIFTLIVKLNRIQSQ